MKIPETTKELEPWAKELIDECRVSLDERRMAAKFCRNVFYTGAVNDIASKHNKCFSHVTKLSSYLFSPADVRFSIDFEGEDDQAWSEKATAAERRLNGEFKRRKCGIAMSQAVLFALLDCSCFIKMVWGHSGLEPHVIPQHFMGVLREDVDSMDRQDAFTHSFYLTKAQFGRLLLGNPRRAEILDAAQSAYAPAGDDLVMDSYIHEIIAGGTNPISTSGTPSNQFAQVGVFGGQPSPMLAPEVASELIRVDDLWVFNDKLGDWTTIRYVDPGVIVEGAFRHRNLSDAPKQHPFIKVCPNEIVNYFWGRSELANLVALQGLLNQRVNDVDHIFRLQAKPPKAFLGMSGVTPEKARALLVAGGEFIDNGENPNAKVQAMAPEMPSNALAWLETLERYFDENGGFTPLLSGQGEAGVRTQGQANTLLRTASPRLRDRAFIVEQQCAGLGELSLNIMQAKDATVLKAGSGEFILEQLPEDAHVSVDSHTSSPAFSGDNANLFFALAKAGAIQGDDLIDGVHAPNADRLKKKYRARQKAQEELIAKNPSLLEKVIGRRR
ncbi:MAG: hypothetical protein KGL39_39080 [Patescibacteria group bacterium]|nr:hypothetical protein [Patescibacteria group bacterium]